MIVTSTPVELVIPESKHPRSPGVHLSSIIRCVAQENGILEREEDEEITLADWREIKDPVARNRICLGLAWEEFYIGTQLPEVVDHPGELHFDDVYMTPDGEELTTLFTTRKWGLKVHEVKCTYKSLNTVGFRGEVYDSAVNPVGPLTGQWMWLAQIKSYALAKETCEAALHVNFVCGNYSRPIRPFACRYDLVFTEQELLDNWELLRNYRDYRLGR